MQNSMGRWSSLIILMLVAKCLSAQTRITLINGNGFQVKNASVSAWTPFGLEVAVQKDSAGNYTVDKEINRIRVISPDFRTLDSFFKPDIALGSHIVLEIFPNDVILEQAVVSVNKSEVKLKESVLSISVLKPYIIENKITTDISQALDQVPGVNVADNQINIRNGNGWSYGAGSRVMVLVDDLPILSADAQTAQFSFMPVENVGSIEIVKSAGSVLYGSSALNGVVNLRTSEPTSKASARVSAFAGFFDHPANDSLMWNKNIQKAYGSSGYWSQKIGANSVSITFNALNNEGYRMHEFDRRLRFSIRYKRNSELIKGLSYGLASSVQQGKSGSFLLWENFGYGYTPLDSGFNYSNSSKLSVDPFAEYKKGSWSHKLIGRMLLIDNQIDNGNPSIDQSNGSSLYYGEYRIGKHLANLRQNMNLDLNGGLVGIAGETHSPLFSGNQQSRNMAAYFQAGMRYNRFQLQAGGRYEYYRLNGFKQSRPVFRAGCSYSAAPYSIFRLSWGQGYRFPSMAEAFISTSAGSVTVFPNPGLLPETGRSAEFGFKQGFRIGKLRGFADLAAFEMKYQNLMEFTFGQWGSIFSPNFGAGFKSINTPGARIRGLEAEITGEGQAGPVLLRLLTGYTYTIPVNTSPSVYFATDSVGNQLNFENTRAVSNHYLKYRYKHLFRFDLQGNYRQCEVGLSFRYNSAILNIDKAFISFPLNTSIPDIERAWKKLDHVFVTDLRFGWKFTKNWKLQAQILNLFNALYMNRPADLRPPRSFQVQAVWFI